MKAKIRWLLFTDAWLIFAAGMFGPIYAIFVENIGGNILDASWAYFAFAMPTGILIYFFGHLEDHIKIKEKAIVLGYALTSLGYLSYIFVATQTHLIFTQILLGIAGAILAPAYDAVYSQSLDKKKEASEWGDYEALYRIVTGIAAIIGGYIAYTFGFRSLFMVMFFASVLATLCSYHILQSVKNKRKR